jgi:hypothetical protein
MSRRVKRGAPVSYAFAYDHRHDAASSCHGHSPSRLQRVGLQMSGLSHLTDVIYRLTALVIAVFVLDTWFERSKAAAYAPDFRPSLSRPTPGMDSAGSEPTDAHRAPDDRRSRSS